MYKKYFYWLWFAMRQLMCFYIARTDLVFSAHTTALHKETEDKRYCWWNEHQNGNLMLTLLTYEKNVFQIIFFPKGVVLAWVSWDFKVISKETHSWVCSYEHFKGGKCYYPENLVQLLKMLYNVACETESKKLFWGKNSKVNHSSNLIEFYH